jgi:tRNA nucleotidyltransferase (CCA-adding enzyme)
MQFAARFDLRAAPETIELCRSIKGGFAELAAERVLEEWFKWAEKSVVPSAGLKFLVETEWVDLFPEIKALINTPQEPLWHPEGDVFIHTCHCCDAMARLPEWQGADPESRIVYMLAILAHDFGKPATTQRAIKDGQWRIVSPGHEELGGPLSDAFLNRIAAPQAIRDRIIPLVTNHLFHFQEMTDRAVRRLAKRLEPENIFGLSVVMTADSMGRPPQPAVVPENVKKLLARAHELEVKQAPAKPILLGRHLIELGMEPGVEFGTILKGAYDAQMEGRFFDLPQALRWLHEQTDIPVGAAVRERLSRMGTE